MTGVPKMRSHRSAAKRFRRSGSGKIMRRKAFASHLLEKKSSTRKRRLGRPTRVSKADEPRARRMLGG